jgi:hypothetical protein
MVAQARPSMMRKILRVLLPNFAEEEIKTFDITKGLALNPGRGWSTLDALRLHPKTRDISVILRSTDMRLINEKADLLRELNCQTLEKPFDIETLLDKVAAAIGPPPA